MKQRADRMRLISIVGLVLGGLLTIGGLVLAGITGPEALILGLIVLMGSVVLFRRSRHARDDDDRAPAASSAEQWYLPANVYERVLLWGGAALVVVGGIVSVAAANQVADAERGIAIRSVLGVRYDDSELAATAGLSTFGWVLLGLGVVMLLIWLAQRASSASSAKTSPAP